MNIQKNNHLTIITSLNEKKHMFGGYSSQPSPCQVVHSFLTEVSWKIHRPGCRPRSAASGNSQLASDRAGPAKVVSGGWSFVKGVGVTYIYCIAQSNLLYVYLFML